MRRALVISAWIGLLASLAAGCSGAGDAVEGLRSAADGLRGDSATAVQDPGFCLALARVAAAIESGSPDTAEEAAEEALARAPEPLLDATRTVTEALRTAREAGDGSLADPELRHAVDRLAESARDLCEPT